MFQFQNLRSHCLTQVQDRTASEVAEVDFLCHIFTNLIVFIDFLCLTQTNLGVRILYLIICNYNSVTVDFKISILRVYDHIEILIRAILLLKHVVKRFLNHTDQCCTVNVLCLFELLKGVNKTDLFFVFLCHYIFNS